MLWFIQVIFKVWDSSLLIIVPNCWGFTASGFLNPPPFFLWLFRWHMRWCKRWAGAALTSAPIWKTHSSQQWIDGLRCACLSISAFFCYLWNSSLHNSLCCRLYRTLPSRLINHAIELNATQQKSVAACYTPLPPTSRQGRFSWSRFFAAPIV